LEQGLSGIDANARAALMNAVTWMRRAAVILVLVALAGCSATQPWKNAPLAPGEVVQYDGRAQMLDPGRATDLLVVASFSGGGSRAAAFAHAVISELDGHSFSWRGRQTSLAREIDMVIGVSGGSVAAAHMALHGVPDHLTRFPADFLQVDLQTRVIGAALSPARLWDQSSPWYGRGHVLSDELDAVLFDGATFGHLAQLPGRPYLMIGATDLSSGAEFDFTSEQFELLCSSIDQVPLSFAVAASSSVPLLFSPLSLQNHHDGCSRLAAGASLLPATAADSARVRLVKNELAAYASSGRRFIHLIDGGVSDNLGTRRIVDYVAQVGGIGAVLALLNAGPESTQRAPQRIVLISVNSERRAALPIDGRGEVPSTLAVLDALVYSGLGRQSEETSLVLADAVEQWRTELRSTLPPGTDADIFSIEIKLSELDDDALRDRVLAVPTAFRISDDDLALLRQAAGQSVMRSAEFERFVQSLAPTR
jgi:NTE family protein